MRPHPIADDDLYDDPSPRVVPIGAAGHPRDGATEPPRDRPEPWTPRDYPLPAAPRRPAPPIAPEPSRLLFGTTHKVMVAVFGIVCLSMLLGTIAWRMVNDARRSPDPPASSATAAQQPVQQPASGAVPPGSEPTPASPGSGPISTEIRVVQPNYTVAPGDTLASIARRHGTTVDALASVNNLENRNSLSVGQRLIIP